jgi:transcriptional regulator with XRE-family HTH domain
MSKIQESFVKLLSSKKRIIGTDKNTIQRWKRGASSPSIETMEKICILNSLQLPFFHDGSIEQLIEFNAVALGKLGLKGQLIFEDLNI